MKITHYYFSYTTKNHNPRQTLFFLLHSYIVLLYHINIMNLVRELFPLNARYLIVLKPGSDPLNVVESLSP